MKACSLFFCLFFSIIIKAQDIKTAIIKVDTSVSAEAFAIPYSEIKIIDARFDRSKIGCCYNAVFLNRVTPEKYEADFPDSSRLTSQNF